MVHEAAVLAPNPAIAASYADQVNRYRALRAAMIARLDFVAHDFVARKEDC